MTPKESKAIRVQNHVKSKSTLLLYSQEDEDDEDKDEDKEEEAEWSEFDLLPILNPNTDTVKVDPCKIYSNVATIFHNCN